MKASKLFGLFLALLSLAICSRSVCADPPTAGEGALVDNPFYGNWAAFAIGSTKTVREVTTLHDGVKIKEKTSTLKEISEDRIVLESVTTELRDVAEIVDAPQTIIIPAKISKEAFAKMEFLSSPTKDSVHPETPGATMGKETLDVGGEKLDCDWIANSWTDKEGGTHSSKVWLNKDVPGHLVKWTREAKSPTHTSNHETMLVSFIAKPAK